MMQLGYTWEKLTIGQLVGAAHDLDNAALVIEHAGHFQGALVNAWEGSVCMVGAIDLATYRSLEQLPAHTHKAWVTRILASVGDAGVFRAECAIVTAAETVPIGLCGHCSGGSRENFISEPWSRVSHYNDMHCTGGPDAITVLRDAATMARAQAEVKRVEFANYRVPTNA